MKHNPSKKTTENYQSFLRIDTRRYRGEWIALAGKKIVAHGKRADLIYEKATKLYPSKKISLAKVPKEETLVLWYVSVINRR